MVNFEENLLFPISRLALDAISREPLLRFVRDDGMNHPDAPPSNGWNGSLPLYPPDVLAPETPPQLDGIGKQPGWGTQPQSWYERRKLEEAEAYAWTYMKGRGWGMAARLLDHFISGSGAPFRVGADDVDSAVLHSAWAKSALFYGQNVSALTPDPNDPRHQLDRFMVPIGSPGSQYQPGMQAEIDAAVNAARVDPDLLGKPQSLQVDWMRMPANSDNTDNADVHNAFGHHYIGAAGVVEVTESKDRPGEYDYRVQFQPKVWDYYKFDTRIPLEDDSTMTRAKIGMNNLMRAAHGAGLGQNFLTYGTGRDIVQEGTTAGGAAPRDTINYYYADSPDERYQVSRNDLYDPGRKPPEADHGYAGYAAGGDVKGPGSSIGDKIPAYLSDGEFIMNARSTAMNRPFLQALNADPYFLQKMLGQRSERGRSNGGQGYGQGSPSSQPATVNISMSSQEDIVARLKILSQQWELMRAN
ncbi:hypothetical protein ACWDYH_13390 [Nocardia goodfellowii]